MQDLKYSLFYWYFYLTKLWTPQQQKTNCRHAEKSKDRQAVTQTSYFYSLVLFLPKTERHNPAKTSCGSNKKPAAELCHVCRQAASSPPRPENHQSKPASSSLDVFKQFIFVIISKKRRAAIKRARCTLSAEGPTQPATLHSLFYFISLGF